MRVRATQGDTIDAICQRVYGRTAGVTEAVLAANPGIADLGPILPHGAEPGAARHLPAAGRANGATVGLTQRNPYG